MGKRFLDPERQKQLVLAALDRWANMEYRKSLEQIAGANRSIKDEFTRLQSILESVIEETQRLLNDGASNG